MTIAAISGLSGVGSIQSNHPPVPKTEATPAATPAEPLPTGTYPPLTPAVLALLVGEQVSLYGTSNGG